MTREEAIKKYVMPALKHAWNEKVNKKVLEALEQEPTQIDEIPQDYVYDTETKDFLVYRHKYTGDEIHIKKPIPVYTLEQEPCEDAISRQAAIDVLTKTSGIRGDALKALYDLPSVTPQEPRKGHWEHGRELSRVFIGDALRGINYEDWHCSNCHCVIEQSIKPKWNYCPNCGCCMVELQESER